jgi:hypothetical protein
MSEAERPAAVGVSVPAGVRRADRDDLRARRHIARKLATRALSRLPGGSGGVLGVGGGSEHEGEEEL